MKVKLFKTSNKEVQNELRRLFIFVVLSVPVVSICLFMYLFLFSFDCISTCPDFARSVSVTSGLLFITYFILYLSRFQKLRNSINKKEIVMHIVFSMASGLVFLFIFVQALGVLTWFVGKFGIDIVYYWLQIKFAIRGLFH